MFKVTELSFDEICEMQEVGKIIRQQIGLPTLLACGAREWRFNDDGTRGTQFRVNKGVKRQFIRVTLEADDTYTVLHYRLKPVTDKVVYLKQVSDVYCEMLSSIIYDMVNKGE